MVPLPQIAVEVDVSPLVGQGRAKPVLTPLILGEGRGDLYRWLPAWPELGDTLDLRAIDREVGIHIEVFGIAFNQLLQVLGVDGVANFTIEPLRKPVMTFSHSRSNSSGL